MPIINIGILADNTPVYRENVYFCRIVRRTIIKCDKMDTRLTGFMPVCGVGCKKKP